MSELDTLVPAPAVVEAAGERVEILPLKVGQLPAFLRAVAPVIEQLKLPEIDWLALMAEHGEHLLGAIAVATGKARAWVDALAPDEAVALAAKVLEVNADFFTRRVIPRFEQLFAKRQPEAQAPAGSTPSSG